MSDELAVVGLGRMPYADALALQRRIALQRIDGSVARDVLLLVEHPAVITLGRTAHAEHLLASPEALRARGIDVFEIERGGDITYHGPGQLVAYAIFDLNEHEPDLHRFLRQLEECIIRAVAPLGVRGTRREGLTGVWVEHRKLASIGVHVKQWVTWHGLALNVATDLAAFEQIVPCGIDGVIMTSLQNELRERAPRDLWSRAADHLVEGFCEVFGFAPQMVEVGEV